MRADSFVSNDTQAPTHASAQNAGPAHKPEHNETQVAPSPKTSKTPPTQATPQPTPSAPQPPLESQVAAPNTSSPPLATKSTSKASTPKPSKHPRGSLAHDEENAHEAEPNTEHPRQGASEADNASTEPHHSAVSPMLLAQTSTDSAEPKLSTFDAASPQRTASLDSESGATTAPPSNTLNGYFLLAGLGLTAIAAGSGSGSGSGSTDTITGFLIDSPVQGVSYYINGVLKGKPVPTVASSTPGVTKSLSRWPRSRWVKTSA